MSALLDLDSAGQALTLVLALVFGEVDVDDGRCRGRMRRSGEVGVPRHLLGQRISTTGRSLGNALGVCLDLRLDWIDRRGDLGKAFLPPSLDALGGRLFDG